MVDVTHEDDLGRFLTAIALPHTVGPLSPNESELVTRWFDVFDQCVPTITPQDVMGLIVLRLTHEYLPEGDLDEPGALFANLKALALAANAAPDRMKAAGFTVRQIVLPPGVSGRVYLEVGWRVRLRWLDWYKTVLNPRRAPDDERETIVRGLARLKCFRETVGEEAAMRRAKRLLDRHFLGLGHGKANLDPEDTMQELYTFDRGELAGRKLLTLRKDGCFIYRPEVMADVLRKTKHRASGNSAAGIEVLENTGAGVPDPAYQVEVAELRARLVDECDDRNRFIVEHWEESDSEIGRNLDISKQAVRKRRAKIKESAERLAVDLCA